MSKLIITTVGTSIISNRLFPEGYNTQIEELKSGTRIRNHERIIDETTAAIKRAIDNNGPNKLLSAELASLRVFEQNHGISKDDTIVLFSTDTEDCRFCAEVNKKVLNELGWCNVPEPVVIEGLKTRRTEKDEDISKTFMEAGLRKLSEETENILNKGSFDEKYFNITGGFKATIPFVTILAFNKGITLIYLYEESNELIIISPPEPECESMPSYDDLLALTSQLGG